MRSNLQGNSAIFIALGQGWPKDNLGIYLNHWPFLQLLMRLKLIQLNNLRRSLWDLWTLKLIRSNAAITWQSSPTFIGFFGLNLNTIKNLAADLGPVLALYYNRHFSRVAIVVYTAAIVAPSAFRSTIFFYIKKPSLERFLP
jgi:hypothetical protein